MPRALFQIDDNREQPATSKPNQFKAVVSEEEKQRYLRAKPSTPLVAANKRRQRYVDAQLHKNEQAAARLAASQILLTESSGFLEAEDNEKTYKFRQTDIKSQVDFGTQTKALDLTLSFGPYYIDYTRNGKYMLLGGKKGSLAVLEANTLDCLCEFNVRETVRAVKFCHDQTLWAAAQKKYLYIYDQNGLELHCLRDHMLTYQMDFLPYHFLLTSIGEFGLLRWLDVSTGLCPAAFKTKKGPCNILRHNPFTAIVGLGHSDGTVSFWNPNIDKPSMEIQAHRGKVSCAEFINQHQLATAGYDGFWRIWDLRAFKSLYSNRFKMIPKCMRASQSELLALGFGNVVQIWKDQSFYMEQNVPNIESLNFRPYEDIITVGHARGVSNAIVPGSCISNYDSLSANPFESKKLQRREREIHQLLDKLPIETIAWDPSIIGTVQMIEHEVEESKRTQEKETKKRKKKTMKTAEAALKLRKEYAELVRKKKEKKIREQQIKDKQESFENITKFDPLETFRKRDKPTYT